ncbi:MAG: 16S rRNA (cytosine(967)-C(5))-methyltransferase RsmB [Pseudomonadota bacterium]|nr:16S rRNA (cytosine(967)-C(5))-methyltransferase RsmB [Pseudomonadota bacterium]
MESSGFTGSASRAVAARVSARILRDGITAEKAINEIDSADSRDQGLIRAFVLGTLRWYHRLQWQLDRLLSHPLGRRETELAALIRLGLFQLQWMRIPDHAAVSATVAAADLLGKAHTRGLVNAVLRRFLREAEKFQGELQNSPEAFYSHPSWLLEVVRDDWMDSWKEIVTANNEHPPMWLRVNLSRATRREYMARLSEAGILASTVPGAGPGALLLEVPQPAGSLPGFEEGLVSIQDGAAQFAAGFLGIEPGYRVLDACAAPGGKTAQILETCAGLGQLLALDRDQYRLQSLAENLDRLKLQGTLRHADATRPSDWWDGKPFQRILIDAPCSAVGVIRRHPDIKILRQANDMEEIVLEQAKLLRTLWPLLSVGGRLLYATCTVLKNENHYQIERFLRETPGAHTVRQKFERQIMPGEANMDGFYYASIEKKY